MGTNYYLRIKPKESELNKLKQLIDANNNPSDILKTTEDLFGSVSFDYETRKLTGGKLHLGKRSMGWKFLWNPNWYFDNGIVNKFYDLTKESIKAFIDNSNNIIIDEYNVTQDKEEFWQMALSWGQPNGWDYAAYIASEKPKNVFADSTKSEFWEMQGFETDMYGVDFYSDGLRFSTSLEFC